MQKPSRNRLNLVLMAVVPLVAIGASPAYGQQQQQSAVSLTDGYVLGIGDIIEVAVLGREDFRPRVEILPDGTITLPLVGSIRAADQTLLQLRDAVRRALVAGGYFVDPAVNISVATYASRYVTVLGEVATPGVVPISRAYRLSEVIARAGGIKDNGSRDVTLTRPNGETLTLSVEDVATGGTASDPVVNPGDKVFVPLAKTFYVSGEVKAPGNYRVEPGMTLRMAIARGGGLTQLGSAKRVKLYRNDVEVKKVPLDEKILPEDVIVIGERFF